jgi:hypothetical protein
VQFLKNKQSKFEKKKKSSQNVTEIFLKQKKQKNKKTKKQKNKKTKNKNKNIDFLRPPPLPFLPKKNSMSKQQHL